MKNIKKLRFWGTSAGEGVPTPFCRCKICEYAREHGGKDLRTRSCFRLDESVMIDAGADFIPQAHRLGEDTYDVQHIIYSHTHSDHFNPKVWWFRSVSPVRKSEKLDVYLSEYAIKILDKMSNGKEPYLETVNFHTLKFYETYNIDKYKVTPLKGHHHTDVEPNAANYIIDFPDGRRMYYALDSGPYLDETYEYLKNVKLDILVSECTFPVENMGIDVHMGLTEARETLDKLYAQGTIDGKTKIYMTHICCMGMNHDQLVEYWKNTAPMYDITVAYDGLSMECNTQEF